MLIKTIVLSFCAVTMLGLFAGSADWTKPSSPAAEVGAGRVPVVVELFTSEGCSSCPPADLLLAKLDEQQPMENVEVIAIEEHVDYWDELGWRDAFSSPEWTERQYAYAGKLGNRNAFTPQMVVGGRSEFVGSQAARAREAITLSASQPKIAVSLVQKRSEKSSTEAFVIEVGKPAVGLRAKKMEIWLAITEAGLHSSVKAGENSGRELHHGPVLRSLKKVGQIEAAADRPFRGLFQAGLQKEWKREQLRAVAMVQEKSNGQIVGAAQIRFIP